ncbi:Uncharacterised protein [Escherichia coli]|mgnify:FL=1|nr:Uncharacterised protein [Escherichia coli]GEF25361.1 hypothetical protein ECEC3734_00945 [Escherichia coli O145:H28]CUA09506.1 Uncharacterised protein [Escherichia coli]GDG57747.1 hypothetical protein BvCmsKKP035_01900 [Escherichia coli]GEG65815.1 hypothetical protein EC140760_02273 [Escherichia coli O145:H28]
MNSPTHKKRSPAPVFVLPYKADVCYSYLSLEFKLK